MAIIDAEFLSNLKSIEDRFWVKVHKTETCWIWSAGRERKGYGRFYVRGQHIMAHRAAYLLVVGQIPEGKILDHKCHNKSCVNPAHLRPVTIKQNGENQLGPQITNTTGYRGVFFDKRKSLKPWFARVVHNGEYIHGGMYATAEEANEAVIAMRNQLFTHNDADRKAA